MPEAPKSDARTRIVEATMALAAERDWPTIELADIAARADVSLADLRDAFPSKGAILGGFMKMIDRKVLDGVNDDLAGEPAKDRLFDVLMRRIDALAPYREALRRLRTSLPRDPLTLLAMNSASVNSHRYMLAAANIPTSDPVGGLKAQGLAIAFSRVVDGWLKTDDDPELSKTMAALDRALTRGGAMLDRAEDAMRLTAPFRAFCHSFSEAGEKFRERMRAQRSRRNPDRDAARPDDEIVAI
ncbi:MAG: TetR family transcriptional regulator [Rhizobiales bacterium 65-9]|nr:TetR/AcrR family transcriptional regulator [Hyphomicrobiales bacterium]OJY35465.1 MAG: TetR family transcriptional regulator [Rhizobiales bacterium 65-9]